LHSAKWWHRHWERTGIVAVELADNMPDGWRAWLDWQRANYPENLKEIQALEMDGGRYLGYVRAAGRRRIDVQIDEPIVTVPTQYTKVPLLRC
jgi:hypothetical protein